MGPNGCNATAAFDPDDLNVKFETLYIMICSLFISC